MSLYEVVVLRKNVFSGTNAFLFEGLDEEGYIGSKKKLYKAELTSRHPDVR